MGTGCLGQGSIPGRFGPRNFAWIPVNKNCNDYSRQHDHHGHAQIIFVDVVGLFRVFQELTRVPFGHPFRHGFDGVLIAVPFPDVTVKFCDGPLAT
jgi:hypothetical protein